MLSQSPRARATDPLTSHVAADNAGHFAGTHAARILAALESLDTANAREISLHTGLSVEQCCRRTVELQRARRIAVALDLYGSELTRDGYRVWRLL